MFLEPHLVVKNVIRGRCQSLSELSVMLPVETSVMLPAETGLANWV